MQLNADKSLVDKEDQNEVCYIIGGFESSSSYISYYLISETSFMIVMSDSDAILLLYAYTFTFYICHEKLIKLNLFVYVNYNTTSYSLKRLPRIGMCEQL